MSVLTDIADAVVTEINTGFPALVRPAFRLNVPRFSADEMNNVQITVRPKDRVTTKSTRSIVQDVVRVYVGIQRQCKDDTNEESDPLIDLGDQIQSFFDMQRPLSALPPIICENSSFGQDNDSSWLNLVNQNQLLIYTGLIVLTFRVSRQGRVSP